MNCTYKTKCKLNLHETQINLVKSLLEFLNFHANLCMCHSLTTINHSDLNPAIVNYKLLNNTILLYNDDADRQTNFYYRRRSHYCLKSAKIMYWNIHLILIMTFISKEDYFHVMELHIYVHIAQYL